MRDRDLPGARCRAGGGDVPEEVLGATTVRPRTIIIACQRHVTRCGTLMHPRGNAISSVRFSVLCSALATAPSREAM